MSNYTVIPNIKTGMIEVRGGSANGTKICEFPLDEAADIIDQMVAASKKFAFMMNNPLLHERYFGSANWCESAVALFGKAGVALHNAIALSDKLDIEVVEFLQETYNQIDMVVEANKHHLPESSLARGSITTTANAPPSSTGEAGTRSTESSLPGHPTNHVLP